MPRLIKDKNFVSSPTAVNSPFTLDLQRELATVKRFARKSGAYNQQPSVAIRKNRSKIQALRKTTHRDS
jgi:hypothetical protein